MPDSSVSRRSTVRHRPETERSFDDCGQQGSLGQQGDRNMTARQESSNASAQTANIQVIVDLRDASVVQATSDAGRIGRVDHGTGTVDNVSYLPFQDSGRLGNATPAQLFIKRAADITITTLVLVLLAPLLAITAAIIKTTSPGPVLHRQIRIGQHGRPFTFLKFRSMYIDAEARKADLGDANEADGPIFKIKNDPRITPIGRIIRKLSIDETPQLLHVLSGRMTLVGPRPHLPEEVAAYTGHAHRRLAVKPGITGIWQVSGRSDLDFDTWIQLDLQYLDTWTLGLDAKLLAQTLTAVATGKGAY
jgi:lipopolysaccharide/colanic/teichoic acid biosynthesis glycosyltransferase